jgi:D-aspartate ligase
MPTLAECLRRLPYPVPVVMDASWANGLGVIRSLGREGLKSVAMSPASVRAGGASRHSIDLRCPNPATEPENLVQSLLDLGKILPYRGVLLVTDDTFLTVLADAREQLEEHFFFTFPEGETLFPLMDKLQQYRTALDCGVQVPRTTFLDDEADTSSWPSSAFPAVLKGRMGKAFQRACGRQVLVVNHAEELRSAYQQYGKHGLILQEVVPGGDERLYTLGACIAQDGTVLAAFTGRKLRQTPPGFGICRMGESLLCLPVREQGLKLLAALGFHGVAQVEFKHDPRDNSFRLIEVNARFWMWHSLATYCGVNLAHIAYLDAVGGDPQPYLSQRVGPRWVLLLDDLMAAPADIRDGRLTFREWASSLRPPIVDGVIDIHDPMPILSMVRRQARQVLRHPSRADRARQAPGTSTV